MKTRIVILISFVLLFVACSEDKIPLPEPDSPHPQLSLSSPEAFLQYGAGVAIPIKGDISDPEIMETLSVMVYRDASAKDTLFHTSRNIKDRSTTINETWTPSTLDFAGATNAYLLEVKITHGTTSATPSLSFFQEVQVYK